jgi:hypothetical protein
MIGVTPVAARARFVGSVAFSASAVAATSVAR